MKSRSVDLRSRPPVRLHHGDCLDVLRGMRKESVHSVVCDPPYGISYQNKKNKTLQPGIINDKRPFIWWLWDAARVLKTGGALVCFCRWDVQETFRWAIELAGLNVRSQGVWDRMRHGMGDCSKTLAPRHDVMWFATKGRYKFPNGRPKSVIQSASVFGKSRMHPTEKPESLMREIVRGVTPKRGIVLDPCMGSGATGACVKDGYGFVGVELDPTYYLAARMRLAAALTAKRKKAA